MPANRAVPDGSAYRLRCRNRPTFARFRWPKNSCHMRFTATRAVSGLSRDTIHRASDQARGPSACRLRRQKRRRPPASVADRSASRPAIWMRHVGSSGIRASRGAMRYGGILGLQLVQLFVELLEASLRPPSSCRHDEVVIRTKYSVHGSCVRAECACAGSRVSRIFCRHPPWCGSHWYRASPNPSTCPDRRSHRADALPSGLSSGHVILGREAPAAWCSYSRLRSRYGPQFAGQGASMSTSSARCRRTRTAGRNPSAGWDRTCGCGTARSRRVSPSHTVPTVFARSTSCSNAELRVVHAAFAIGERVAIETGRDALLDSRIAAAGRRRVCSMVN